MTPPCTIERERRPERRLHFGDGVAMGIACDFWTICSFVLYVSDVGFVDVDRDLLIDLTSKQRRSEKTKRLFVML